MLPLSWKLYKAFNYVLLIYASILLLLIATIVSVESLPDDSSFYIFVTGVILILVASIININIINRFFPDKALSGRATVGHVLSLIFLILTFIGFSLTIYYALKLFYQSRRNNDNASLIFLITMAIVNCLQLYVIILQMQLRRFVRKNNDQTIGRLIDSIGTNDN